MLVPSISPFPTAFSTLLQMKKHHLSICQCFQFGPIQNFVVWLGVSLLYVKAFFLKETYSQVFCFLLKTFNQQLTIFAFSGGGSLGASILACVFCNWSSQDSGIIKSSFLAIFSVPELVLSNLSVSLKL